MSYWPQTFEDHVLVTVCSTDYVELSWAASSSLTSVMISPRRFFPVDKQFKYGNIIESSRG